jgi:hypothetical protein
MCSSPRMTPSTLIYPGSQCQVQQPFSLASSATDTPKRSRRVLRVRAFPCLNQDDKEDVLNITGALLEYRDARCLPKSNGMWNTS